MRGKGGGEQYKDEGSNQERKRVRRERMKGGSSCVVKLKVQFCMQRKRFEECAQNLTFCVGGAKCHVKSLYLCACGRL